MTDDSESDNRGLRVRVTYPALSEYRYMQLDAEGWHTTDRAKARIFDTPEEASEAIRVFKEKIDLEIPGITCEPEPIGSFDPDWVTKPGSHVHEYIEDGIIGLDAFLSKTGFTPAFLEQLYDGDAVITEEVAEKLAQVLGADKGFWLRLEANYREGVRKGLRVS